MDRETRRKQQNQSVGRASLLWRRDLAWTLGFPLLLIRGEQKIEKRADNAIDWYPLAQLSQTNGGRCFRVGRGLIQRSELAASKLRHQYPRAIKKVLSDPEQWFERFDCLMAGLKRAVHQGDFTALVSKGPSESWESVQAEAPPTAVANLIDSIRFAERLRRTVLPGQDERWTPEHLSACERIYSDRDSSSTLLENGLTQRELDVAIFTQLNGFVKVKSQRESLQRLLTTPALRFVHHPNPNLFLSIYSNGCKRLVSNTENAQHPDPRAELPSRRPLRIKLLEILQRAIASPQKGEAITEAVCALGTPDTVGLLESLWTEVDTEERRLRGLLEELKALRGVIRLRSPSVRQPMLREVEARPASKERCAIAGLYQLHLNRIASGNFPNRILKKAAALMNCTAQDRVRAMNFVNLLLAPYDDLTPNRSRDERLDQVLSGLLRLAEDFGRTGQLTKMLHPPSTEFAKPYERTLFSHWLPQSKRQCFGFSHHRRTPMLPAETLDDLWQLLKHCLEKKIRLTKHCYWIVPKIIAARLPQDRALALLRQLCHQTGIDECKVDEIRTADKFCDDAKDLSPFLLALVDEDGRLDLLQSLTPFEKDPLSRHWIRSWVTKRRWKDLARFAGMVSLLEKGQINALMRPTCHQDREWIETFPPRLRPSLEHLADASKDANKIARNILSSDIVDRNNLQRELEYLRSQLQKPFVGPDEQERLTRRCKNIEGQLCRPKAISPGRLVTLTARVLDRAALEHSRRLENRLSTAVRHRVGLNDSQEVSRSIDDEMFGRVALGVSKLGPTLRKRGEELLRYALLGTQFEELSQPENRALYNGLKSKGIDLGPWMDFEQEWVFRNETDHALTLSFAKSPMDYLLMGHHFRTCLSPGDINFFSAVANAIDLNKRVLYGFEQGRISGRCLVALNAEGQIVRFAAYSHKQESIFSNSVEDVLDRLAVAMNTERGGAGRIPHPVSGRWYDDGAVAPSGQTPESPEAHYRASLKRLSKVAEPSDDNDETLKTSTRQALSALFYEDVINAWESSYPEWMFPTWAEVINRSDAPAQAMLMVADVANRNSIVRGIDHVIGLLGERKLMRIFRNSGCDYPGCFRFHFYVSEDFLPKFFAVINPTLGLRLLRVTRKRRFRSDRLETDTARRELLAICHERLGRNELAMKLKNSRCKFTGSRNRRDSNSSPV